MAGTHWPHPPTRHAVLPLCPACDERHASASPCTATLIALDRTPAPSLPAPPHLGGASEPDTLDVAAAQKGGL